MRTIKFRAKSLEGHNIGEWVFGDLHIRSAFPHIHTEVGTRCKIDPNTIGEFTGLSDKKGTEVYEGDLVRIAETENHVEIIAAIRFDEGKFTANSIKSSVSFSLDYVFRERQPDCLSGEVIGNIYDKPHRMEGGAE